MPGRYVNRGIYASTDIRIVNPTRYPEMAALLHAAGCIVRSASIQSADLSVVECKKSVAGHDYASLSSLLAISLGRHLLVVTLLARSLGLLDLSVLALELLVGSFSVHNLFEKGALPLFLGHSRTEVFGGPSDDGTDLAELRDSPSRVFLVEFLGV